MEIYTEDSIIRMRMYSPGVFVDVHVSNLLNFCQSNGYNSFMISNLNGPMAIPMNISIGADDTLYLLDYEHGDATDTGIANSTSYYQQIYAWKDGNTERFGFYTASSISLSDQVFFNRTYRCWRYSTPIRIGTRVTYSKIYLNDQNVTPVTYTWQSVPSISGKNGILSLAQIKEEYINDGESVSGAAADHFTNLSTGNRVDILIDDALPAPEIGGTTVTVKYTIPSLSSGSYEYCKLVAKKNSMPEGPEDGDKIINVDPTSISASVKYLRGSTKYYFEIFVKTTDGYEAVSNVKSITTGETHDIVLFTDEFNTEILKSGWALDTYKSMRSDGSSGWAPTSFTSDFLSSYNFLCGNGSRRPLSMSNGELWTANETGMTDQTFWIPIERSYINESIIVSFDGKISPIGWSSSYYNYIHVWLAYVDDNNTWHSYDACGDIVTDQQWHNFEHEIQPQFPYIDYIGLCCCDGSSHWKNIKVINV